MSVSECVVATCLFVCLVCVFSLAFLAFLPLGWFNMRRRDLLCRGDKHETQTTDKRPNWLCGSRPLLFGSPHTHDTEYPYAASPGKGQGTHLIGVEIETDKRNDGEAKGRHYCTIG